MDRKNAKKNISEIKKKEDKDETIIEAFRCFICMEKLQEAHLCPHCSKLCCFGCISRWLVEQRHNCPHCRAPLHVNELVNCRWFEEVAIHVENLKQKFTSGLSSSLNRTKDKAPCSTHINEKLSVFCNTCNISICHLCALFDGGHNNHSFQPLEAIYEQHLKLINDEATHLRRRLIKLFSYVDDVEENVDIVRKAKDEKVREMRAVVESIVTRLDTELKAKLLNLMRQKNMLTTEAEKLEQLLMDVEHEMNHSLHHELIKKSPELVKAMKDKCQKAISCYSSKPISAQFASEIVPSYDKGKFILSGFSVLQESGDAVYSGPLNAHAGPTWRLKVYPYGNGTVRGEYLSIFLELTAGYPEVSKYEYRIQMSHRTPEKIILRQFVSDFEVGECWGYNKFFKLNLLAAEGYLNTRTDTLELEFEVRPATFNQKCRDQQWYIKQLLRTQSEHLHQLRIMKEKLKKSTTAILSAEMREVSEKMLNLTVNERPLSPKADDLKHTNGIDQNYENIIINGSTSRSTIKCTDIDKLENDKDKNIDYSIDLNENVNDENDNLRNNLSLLSIVPPVVVVESSTPLSEVSMPPEKTSPVIQLLDDNDSSLESVYSVLLSNSFLTGTDENLSTKNRNSRKRPNSS